MKYEITNVNDVTLNVTILNKLINNIQSNNISNDSLIYGTVDINKNIIDNKNVLDNNSNDTYLYKNDYCYLYLDNNDNIISNTKYYNTKYSNIIYNKLNLNGKLFSINKNHTEEIINLESSDNLYTYNNPNRYMIYNSTYNNDLYGFLYAIYDNKYFYVVSNYNYTTDLILYNGAINYYFMIFDNYGNLINKVENDAAKFIHKYGSSESVQISNYLVYKDYDKKAICSVNLKDFSIKEIYKFNSSGYRDIKHLHYSNNRFQVSYNKSSGDTISLILFEINGDNIIKHSEYNNISKEYLDLVYKVFIYDNYIICNKNSSSYILNKSNLSLVSKISDISIKYNNDYINNVDSQILFIHTSNITSNGIYDGRFKFLFILKNNLMNVNYSNIQSINVSSEYSSFHKHTNIILVNGNFILLVVNISKDNHNYFFKYKYIVYEYIGDNNFNLIFETKLFDYGGNADEIVPYNLFNTISINKFNNNVIESPNYLRSGIYNFKNNSFNDKYYITY